MPNPYAFVARIALSKVTDAGTKGQELERLILDVGPGAANELNAKISKANQLTADAKAIRSLPADHPLWRRKGTDGEEMFRFTLRSLNVDLSPETMALVQGLVRAPRESENLPAELAAFATTLDREASEVEMQPLKNKINTFSGEETSIPQYVWSLLSHIGAIKVLYLQDRRKAIGREEAQQLLELKMSRGGPQVLRRIQDTVAALLGVQIDAFRGDSLSRTPQAEAELDVDNFLVQANGSGIREALRLILDNEFEKPSLLLVEEPEMHLHPALEASMMRYLQSVSSSNCCQVFLTTHSTNFLDAADLTNVYFISRDKATTVQLLDLESAEMILPRELGLRLSSLFLYDRLVFVEGHTDEAIIREWASILKVNLSQANVGFVRMGGARNFTHYAASSTLSFLARRQVQSWILLDRDEREDDEIDKFKLSAQEYATVTVLEYREIENLLLNPRAIAELISIKSSSGPIVKGVKSATEDSVRVALEEALEGLKTVAISKRVTKSLCVPLYPGRDIHEVREGENIEEKICEEIDRLRGLLDGAKARISEVHRIKTDEINSHWGARARYLAPGELALDLTLQKFGLRFNKDHDGSRLASLMKEGEVDPEMASFIRELGAPPVTI